MSWEGILKEYDATRDITSMSYDFERERAKSNLKVDIANVIRELEDMKMRMGDTDLTEMTTEEIKELSDALGKVSVLLQ